MIKKKGIKFKMKITGEYEKRDQGNFRKEPNGTSRNKNIVTKIKRKIPMDGLENKPDTNGEHTNYMADLRKSPKKFF